jgi:hypothetical protein
MNPIASISVDVLSEPRNESPASGATGDADSAEFGLALAMASAAQSQAAIVPVPVPTGDTPEPPVADAPRGIAENEADVLLAVPRPAPAPSAPPPVTAAETARAPIAPLRGRPVAEEPEAALSPVTVAATAKAPAAPLQAPPVAAQPEGTPSSPAPARPEPARAPASPTSPVAAEVVTAARDASARTADLPLTIHVLELVRGMTEQAARVALDTALSTGSEQDVPLEPAPKPGRNWNAPPQPMDAPVVAAAVTRQALATRVLEALPGPEGIERGRPASRAPLRPTSEVVTRDEAATSGEGWMARAAVVPRDVARADPPMPVPRSGVRPPSEIPAQPAPVPVPEAAGRGRAPSRERTRDGDGPTRAAGAMLAESSAAARTVQANDAVPVSAAPSPPVLQGARSPAGSVDPAAGAARMVASPPEARASARPGDQITLSFSGEDGLEGQLRVAVRGQNVRATILADDPVAAERFSRGLDGLQRALLDRGFTEARLNVQQTARSEGSTSGNVPRDGNQGDSQPRGESRDRYSPPRQDRESASPEERPDRRPSRQRTER